jgi:hypothetical protein
MDTYTLNITDNFYITRNVYLTVPDDVYFTYIEHSPDPWYSDSETDVDIDRDQAIQIIDFLREAFSIE